MAAAARTETGFRRAAWLGLYACAASIALLAIQALVAGRLELTFDEAYYTLWSRFLSFGYLDHPPMVALLIRGSTSLFGGSELGGRGLSLLVVGAMPALIAFIARRAHVDRHAARLNRGGVRRSRCSAGRVLDAWAQRPGRALAHGRKALADRAGLGAWPGAAIEIHRRILGGRRRPRPGRDALAAPVGDLACAVCGPRPRAHDIRPVRRLERRTRLGDLRQAAWPRPGNRIRALLLSRVPCCADRTPQSAGGRRFYPCGCDDFLARARCAAVARRSPAHSRLHDRAGSGLFPFAFAP